jgi:hypothetical protein
MEERLEDTNPPSLALLDSLSDRELIMAVFLTLSAVAERLTGQVPCLMMPTPSGLPKIMHGGDGRVVWIEARAAPEPPPESLAEQRQTQLAIVK